VTQLFSLLMETFGFAAETNILFSCCQCTN